MVVSHEPWIVVLSVLVAIQGAYVGLNLALELPDSTGSRRRLLLAGAAVTLAVAIWSMHFVAMLAVRRRCASTTWCCLRSLVPGLCRRGRVGGFLASSAPRSKPVLAVSAVVMGAGIVTMHFIGMFALHANAMMHHHPAYVAASFLSGWLPRAWPSFRVRRHRPAASGRGIHRVGAGDLRHALTAMAGMTLHPMLGHTMLGGHRLVARPAGGDRRDRGVRQLLGVPSGAGAGRNAGQTRQRNVARRGLLARRAWRGVAPGPDAAVSNSGRGTSGRAGGRNHPRPVAVLPVQKEGATHYLPVGRVHAVKAEAHYTTVFDGTTKFFCGLSITDVEGRLDQSRFMRVHRSHIVAVDRIRR